MAERRQWARLLLRFSGVRLTTDGTPPDFPCILVGNHRSYLDPILILCYVNAIPVSKAEVEQWPILGKGAKKTGIIYLHRENDASRVATLKTIAEALKLGHPVILFPEGTTSRLPGTLEFKKGSFQIAARFGFPIVPCAIHFADPADYWIGDDPFLAHASRRFRYPHTDIHLSFGPALQSKDPNVLLDDSFNWINERLAALQNEVKKATS